MERAIFETSWSHMILKRFQTHNSASQCTRNEADDRTCLRYRSKYSSEYLIAMWLREETVEKRIHMNVKTYYIAPLVPKPVPILYEFLSKLLVSINKYIYQYALIIHQFYQLSKLLLRNGGQTKAPSLPVWFLGTHLRVVLRSCQTGGEVYAIGTAQRG